MKQDTKDSGGLTVSLLLPNNVLALPMQELQMICHHPLLAFMNDFGIGAGVQVLTTSHLFVFQPSQNLEQGRSQIQISNYKVAGRQGKVFASTAKNKYKSTESVASCHNRSAAVHLF